MRLPAVKSPNLLVDKAWNVKLSDFNLSKLLPANATANTSAGTGGGAHNPLWLAPEVLDGGRATAPADVYSFGLTMWEASRRAMQKACGHPAACQAAGLRRLLPQAPFPLCPYPALQLLTWRLPWADLGLTPWQIAKLVKGGQRPEVPPRDQLPGPGMAAAAGFDAYCQLMRCAPAVLLQLASWPLLPPLTSYLCCALPVAGSAGPATQLRGPPLPRSCRA